MGNERWVSIPGYEGYYSVSDRGRIRAEERMVPHYRGGESRLPQIELRPDLGGRYQRVVLSIEGVTHKMSVHRAVCLSFLGTPPTGKPFALHNNGNANDNRLENLRWGSASENMQDKRRHGHNHELNKTHCPRGHAYEGKNLYVASQSGKRQCRECYINRSRNRRRANA